MSFELDYDALIPLDAEDLAEGRIAKAYQSLLPALRRYQPNPHEIEEVLDGVVPCYMVKYRDREYVIYDARAWLKEGESRGRATYAFFDIVNDQLSHSQHRFYALNGGNDLGGMFLTQSECEAARKVIRRRNDWPYLPTLDGPWYGQYYD